MLRRVYGGDANHGLDVVLKLMVGVQWAPRMYVCVYVLYLFMHVCV